VQNLVEQNLGYAVEHISSEDVTRERKDGRERRCIKRLFRRAEGDRELVPIFTKAGIDQIRFSESLGRFVSGVLLDEFRTPYYFGMLRLDAENPQSVVHVWEFISHGRRLSSSEWKSNRRKIVVAAAAITSITEEALRKVPNLRSTIPFIMPITEIVNDAVEDYSKRDIDVSPASNGIIKLAKIEGAAIERLRSLGGYLTHNDYSAANIFLDQNGKPVIFDWDSATLGPPGATLRKMARLPELRQVRMVNLYCTHLASGGLFFRAEDVLFAMRAAEIFRALILGGRYSASENIRAERHFRWGIDHLDYLVA